MRLIPLTKGKFAKVDDWWFDRIMAIGPWCYCEKRKGRPGYAIHYIGGGRSHAQFESMQDVIMPPGFGVTIDHKNLDSLDNQEHNLRYANISQQTSNRNGRVDNTSGVKGVAWHKAARKWQVHVNGQYFGLYSNFDEAVRVRDEQARRLQGEFARLNYPSSGEQGASPAPNGIMVEKPTTETGSLCGDNTTLTASQAVRRTELEKMESEYKDLL